MKHNNKFREEKKFQEEVIQIKRVTKVTSGGRQLRFQALVIVGDEKGRVGIGVGKAGEVVIAVNKAISRAKKRMFTLDTSLGTIPHPVKGKFKASKVILMPASPGTGIIAGGVVRKIISLAGFHNILSKIQGSNNKLNNAKATLEALLSLKSIDEKDYRYEEAKKELAMIEEQREKERKRKEKEEKESRAKAKKSRNDKRKGKKPEAKKEEPKEEKTLKSEADPVEATEVPAEEVKEESKDSSSVPAASEKETD